MLLNLRSLEEAVTPIIIIDTHDGFEEDRRRRRKDRKKIEERERRREHIAQAFDSMRGAEKLDAHVSIDAARQDDEEIMIVLLQ